MSKSSDLLKERKFIKNKEHLSKEDYERLGEIETEIKEIKKSGKDNNVTTKKTNFKKIKENLTITQVINAITNRHTCFMDEYVGMECSNCPMFDKVNCTDENEVFNWLISEVEE